MIRGSQATVCVVPRERFSETEPSLASVLRHTEGNFDLVYVDGCSPPPVRRYLREAARSHRFRLLREDRYLSPNQARNIALSAVETRYVAFVDNDLHVWPRWLERLVACAEETGAWLVSPLCHEGAPGTEVLHMAGGEARIEERLGGRYLRESLHLTAAPAERGSGLKRGRTQLIEFHCVLARTDALRRLGGLDEALLNTREHVDLSLSVGAAGGEIYLEPTAKVTCVGLGPLRLTDLPYFLLRWSDEWTQRSLEHFRTKWRLAEDDAALHEQAVWCANRRRCSAYRWRQLLRRGVGARAAAFLEARLDSAVARWFAPPLRRRSPLPR